MQTFSSKEFRSTVGAFSKGVTIVNTRGEEHAYGMTANAFSSVSLDPPLILVCVINPSEGAEHIAFGEAPAERAVFFDERQTLGLDAEECG